MKNLAIIKIITNDTSDSLLRSLLYLVLFILSTPVRSPDLVGPIDGAFSVSPTGAATYTYDGENRLSSISNALDSVGTPLVETDTYRRGWLVDRSLNGTSVWQLHGEDGQGRPDWVSDQLAQRQLVYDTAGNLLAHRFAFNVPGNHALLAHTYTYDTFNRLTSMDGKAYGYDGYNQLVSWNGNGYSFDAKGNIEVEGAQTSVTYNNYRLATVAHPQQAVWD